MSNRFIPGIFDTVNKMRMKENIKDLKKDPVMPRILNQTILTVPSEDLGQQRLLQDKMRRALDTMHTTLIDDISSFIDRKLPDVDWLTSPTNFDLITSSFISEVLEPLWDKGGEVTAAVQTLDKPTMSFLKLLAYFCVLADYGTVPETLHRKATHWWQDCQPVFHQMKIGIRESSKIDPNKYNRIIPSEDVLDKLLENMKSVRNTILKDKTKKRDGVIRSQKGWNSSINSLFTFLMTNFSSGTESSFKGIEQKISILGDHDLNRAYFSGDTITSTKEATDALKTLHGLVERHLGKKAKELPPEVAQKLALDSPEEHKEYTKAKNKSRSAIKAAFKDFVRSTGKEVVPADAVIEFYTKHDFPNFLPKGFNGKDFGLDEDGNQYYKGVQLSEPVLGGWIKGNPLYDPKTDDTFLVRAQGERTKDPKTIRSYKWAAIGREEKKAHHIEHNVNILPNAMDQWRSDLHNGSDLSELGHLVELLYSTGARIGSENGNTDGEQTFGISSLQRQHVSRGQNGSVVLSYKGKKGVSQSLTIKPNSPENKALVNFILNKAKNKKPNEWLFTEGDSKKRISDTAIRNYMRDHLGWSGGPHKLRSIRANQLFEKYAKRNPPPKNPNQKQMTDWWEDVTSKVGAELGHIRTNAQGKAEPIGSTAAKSYINKDLQREFFKKARIRVPSVIA